MDGRRDSALIEPSMLRFAERLGDEMGARHVLLFGSQARGDARPDSDYDLLIVSPKFCADPGSRRPVEIFDLFDETGNHAPLDLICLTPEEFEYARTHITLVHAVLPEAIELLPNAAPIGS